LVVSVAQASRRSQVLTPTEPPNCDVSGNTPDISVSVPHWS
jgi:hypothetical protein